MSELFWTTFKTEIGFIKQSVGLASRAKIFGNSGIGIGAYPAQIGRSERIDIHIKIFFGKNIRTNANGVAIVGAYFANIFAGIAFFTAIAKQQKSQSHYHSTYFYSHLLFFSLKVKIHFFNKIRKIFFFKKK